MKRRGCHSYLYNGGRLLFDEKEERLFIFSIDRRQDSFSSLHGDGVDLLFTEKRDPPTLVQRTGKDRRSLVFMFKSTSSLYREACRSSLKKWGQAPLLYGEERTPPLLFRR
jgi:hypothetical protein